MDMYRRWYWDGGTVYFTVSLAERGSRLLTGHIDLLRWAVGKSRQERPFEVLGWVVLPDHMHAVWRLPEGDQNYADRWAAIKERFSSALSDARQSPALNASTCPDRGETGIWQKRFREHHIRDDRDLLKHLELCRQAPVRAGLVEKAEDWPFGRVQTLPREVSLVN